MSINNWVLWGAGVKGQTVQDAWDSFQSTEKGTGAFRCSVEIDKVYNGAQPPRTINIH